MNLWKEFHGVNAGYVLELYERYRRDPLSVDPATGAVFEHWQPADDGIPQVAVAAPEKIVAAVNLAQAIRKFGHLAAQLDPLGSPPRGDPELELSTYGLTEHDLHQLPGQIIDGPLGERSGTALEAIQALRQIYCSTSGYDFAHLRVPEERQWLRQMTESRRFRPPYDPFDPVQLLDRLTQVEAFEQFLHRVFPGKTRFSIEGLDMLIPILDELVGEAAELEIRHILIGMAHRGRLNVLAHVLNKPYRQILAEFKDPIAHDIREYVGWTGDVKYHKGARRAIGEGEQVDLTVSLAPNPSHLEFVNPVVQGMARAAGTSAEAAGAPRFDSMKTLPILIHGDAAFPGQGVVAETLNLSRLVGYSTGGTIHIIANNQLGYTTPAESGRSTLYASDLAKGFQIPIVHVNADDVEACIEAARLAVAFRTRFSKDFLIDLVGYRRHGHNEGDEPSFTQPLMYQRIARHPTVRQQWAQRLRSRQMISAETPDGMVRRHMDALQKVMESLKPERDLVEPKPTPPPPGAARRVQTAVSLEQLRQLHQSLLGVPTGFNLHPKIARAMQRRRHLWDELDTPSIEWAWAEQLAFATILADGIPIRLTGQDVERGTFSQRHCVFYDVQTGQRFVPLQALPQANAAFEVHNSPLSEVATMAFEFGYNVQAPKRLVVWEAQYGDFINVAQVVIDEFIVSARAKWGQTPSLVLLLPHGYEGQGPDHSSGRMERFLQLAAETNLRLANCTSAAQYFHLLRRQAHLLETDPLPLIVMTPKSLLRHPLVASCPRDFAQGQWQPVIDDPHARQQPERIRRLILCSGKVYVDLITSHAQVNNGSIAIARVEQLFPFPTLELHQLIQQYGNLEEVIWLQEEPENMGAWTFAQPRLLTLIEDRCPLRYIGRPASASPSEGSMAWHIINQQALIQQALRFELDASKDERVWLKMT